MKEEKEDYIILKGSILEKYSQIVGLLQSNRRNLIIMKDEKCVVFCTSRSSAELVITSAKLNRYEILGKEFYHLEYRHISDYPPYEPLTYVKYSPGRKILISILASQFYPNIDIAEITKKMIKRTSVAPEFTYEEFQELNKQNIYLVSYNKIHLPTVHLPTLTLGNGEPLNPAKIFKKHENISAFFVKESEKRLPDFYVNTSKSILCYRCDIASNVVYMYKVSETGKHLESYTSNFYTTDFTLETTSVYKQMFKLQEEFETQGLSIPEELHFLDYIPENQATAVKEIYNLALTHPYLKYIFTPAVYSELDVDKSIYYMAEATNGTKIFNRLSLIRFIKGMAGIHYYAIKETFIDIAKPPILSTVWTRQDRELAGILLANNPKVLQYHNHIGEYRAPEISTYTLIFKYKPIIYNNPEQSTWNQFVKTFAEKDEYTAIVYHDSYWGFLIRESKDKIIAYRLFKKKHSATYDLAYSLYDSNGVNKKKLTSNFYDIPFYIDPTALYDEIEIRRRIGYVRE